MIKAIYTAEVTVTFDLDDETEQQYTEYEIERAIKPGITKVLSGVVKEVFKADGVKAFVGGPYVEVYKDDEM